MIRTALFMLGIMTVITGLLYPLAMTGLAQLFFPYQADGSLILEDGKVKGSRLLGQSFEAPEYFWSRPSATTPRPYNAASSAGSNLGPLNPDLKKTIEDRRRALQAADPGNTSQIPIDLVTASGSGLDPHISPEAARYQVARVARHRGISVPAVQKLVDSHVQSRQLGFLGEPVVNVTALNRALDDHAKSRQSN